MNHNIWNKTNFCSKKDMLKIKPKRKDENLEADLQFELENTHRKNLNL